VSKPTDRDRIIRILSDTEGLSSFRIKNELNLGDERYLMVRAELLQDQLVEKYTCRGGGIRLSRKGERVRGAEIDVQSTVINEAGLYAPFASFLTKQAEEDEIHAVVCQTHQLKARGQWQNPDLGRITIESFKHLRKLRVVVTTYELKQFPRWNVSAVYEAASHHRFSHEAYVVLEWPSGIEFSLTDPTYKIDQIVRECQRHGMGLATFHPHYSTYRLRPRLDPTPTVPDDEDVETWLDYVFSRNPEALASYNSKMTDFQNSLLFKS
jgi:hypothetical protein